MRENSSSGFQMRNNIQIDMHVDEKLVVNPLLPKRPLGTLNAAFSHSPLATETHSGRKGSKIASSEKIATSFDEHHHRKAVNVSNVDVSESFTASTPPCSPSFSSFRERKQEQVTPNECECIPTMHFEGHFLSTPKPFSKPIHTSKRSLKHATVRDKNSNLGGILPHEPSKLCSDNSSNCEVKEIIISTCRKNPESSLCLIHSSASSPAPAESHPCDLNAYMDAVLKTGFTVKIGGTPRPPRQPRPTIKNGFSIIDWHRKIEQRKLTTSTEIPSRRIFRSEIQEHCSRNSLWMVVRGVVYDVTDFQYYHPTLVNVVLKGAGHDVTALTEAFHPWINVHAFLVTYAMGVLATEDSQAACSKKVS